MRSVTWDIRSRYKKEVKCFFIFRKIVHSEGCAYMGYRISEMRNAKWGVLSGRREEGLGCGKRKGAREGAVRNLSLMHNMH